MIPRLSLFLFACNIHKPCLTLTWQTLNVAPHTFLPRCEHEWDFRERKFPIPGWHCLGHAGSKAHRRLDAPLPALDYRFERSAVCEDLAVRHREPTLLVRKSAPHVGATLDGIRERLAWAIYERAKSFDDPPRREDMQTEISSLEGKREAYAPLEESSNKIVRALRVTIDPRHRQELKMPAAISQACTELQQDYYRPPSDAFLGLARSLAASLWMTLLEEECTPK